MARIPLPGPDDPSLDPRAAEMLRRVEQSGGEGVLNVHRALANHPELMQAFSRFAAVAYTRNGLNPVQRELAYYVSAVTNSCFY
jgi:alkylhydroperoxidase family enzyme